MNKGKGCKRVAQLFLTTCSMLIKMVDRPNTTPIGQGGASQWLYVLFDPHLCEVRPRNFVFL